MDFSIENVESTQNKYPIISIIVPVYNAEKYLDRCINSVLNQTFKKLELILVDDGSFDRSPEICDYYNKIDSRVRVIHKKNQGQGIARNVGLQCAKGSYIGFVDADDYIHPEMYEILYELLKKYPQCELAECDYHINHTMMRNEICREKILNKEQALEYFFRENGGKSNTAVWKYLISADLLNDFNFSNYLFEDLEASFFFFTHITFMVQTTKKLYYYVNNRVGLTRSKFSKSNLDYLVEWDSILEIVYQEYPEFKSLAELNRARANFTLLARMKLNGFDNRDLELCSIKKELKSCVRKDFYRLIKIKMGLARKILLIILSI